MRRRAYPTRHAARPSKRRASADQAAVIVLLDLPASGDASELATFEWAEVVRRLELGPSPLAYTLRICATLLARERAVFLRTHDWTPSAPPAVYQALVARRAAAQPGAWVLQVILPLLATTLPADVSLAELAAAPYLGPECGGDAEARRLADGGVEAYIAGVWVATRLGGPPDPQIYSLDALRWLLRHRTQPS
jgi:hypothetical protein